MRRVVPAWLAPRALATLALSRCALAALAAGGGWGCRGCHDDHPFVPYTIPSTQPSVDAAVAAVAVGAGSEAGVAEAAAPFSGEAAWVAPPGTTRWEVDGVKVDAPPGDVIVSAIARDFDGDGKKDVFAVVRPADVNDPGVPASTSRPIGTHAASRARPPGGANVTGAPVAPPR